MTVFTGNATYNPEEYDLPVPFIQAELNDMTQDLNVSKESAQQLGLRLKAKDLLAQGRAFYWYRARKRIKTVCHVRG